MSRRGFGRGKGGWRLGIGGPTHCMCLKCGIKIPHVRDVPCLSRNCPKCGSAMIPST